MSFAPFTALVVCGGIVHGCLPRGDLSAHSIGADGSDAGVDQEVVSSPVAGGDSGAPADPGPEEMIDSLPLAPQPEAGAPPSAVGSMNGARDAGGESVACDGPGEFAGVGGQGCYLLSRDVDDWFGAREACQRWGGDLVSIESSEEDALISREVAIAIWIGAHDRDVENEFEWADGRPVVFENWDDGQPDNFQGMEHCAEKRLDDNWNDRPCGGDPQEYLCER